MKKIGYLLIVVGFLWGAFLTVERAEGVSAPMYLLALAVGVAGVAISRSAARAEARDVTKLETNIATIESSLAAIAADADRLDVDKTSINVYDLRHRIDETFPEHLAAFVDARESIAHSYGLQAYAEVMNRFAAGERYLNRVWSASTDGYEPEAHDYIRRARLQFDDALETFRRIRLDASS
jgi:RNase adaptor protein for sRNA GlmZ degradation